MPPDVPPEYLLEFQQIGALVRVTAIDPRTGVEAVIQGPASAGELALKQAAMRKLVYLQRRQKKSEDEGNTR